MKYLELCQVYEELEKNPSRLKKTEILSVLLKKLKKENKDIIYLLRGRIFPDYDARETGISSQLTIKAISKSLGVNEKEIIRKWKSQGDLGLVAESLAEKKRQKTLSSRILTAEKVLENLRKLPELQGKGTVEKKIALISELLTSASSLEVKYLIRTLLSDLRIGIGEGVLRDAIVWCCFNKEDKEAYSLVQEAYDKSNDLALVFEKACKGKKELKETFLIPGNPVKVMLYPKVSSIQEAFERAGKPLALEFKYDGFRIMANKDDNGKISLFTRRLEEVSKQFPDIKKYIEENVKANSFILDSEAVGYNPKTKKYKPFQDISQRIKRKYDIEKLEKELPVELIVFDIIYYNGKSLIDEPFKKRRGLIERIINQKKYKIILAEQIVTSDEKEAEKFFEKALKLKQEGLMVKKLDAKYKPGARIGYGFKLKPEENEFDLVIIGAKYGTGKRAGWLTSFDIACRDNNKFLEIGKVSTGLKEKSSEGLSYEDVSKKLKPLIQKTSGRHVTIKPELVVTVTYQNIQKSPTYSSGFALRFPRFTRLRPDRSKEDIATIDEIKKEHKK